MGRKKGLH